VSDLDDHGLDRRQGSAPFVTSENVHWLSTKEASSRLGVTLRSLYRFVDEGELVAYRFGRVIRLKEEDVDRYIESCRIQPGGLQHLYAALKGDDDTEAE
jgi:excisionase family DNA binding protein